MNPIAIMFGVIMLGMAAIFVFKPFRTKARIAVEKATPAPNRREAHTAALTALRALDFDYRTGKVSEEDYPILRAQLVTEAAQYLQPDADQDDRLEDMIRARKMAAGRNAHCPKCKEKLDTDARFCPHCGNDLGVACPSCGKRVRAGDLFCRSCGRQLEIRTEAPA